ncbi:type IV secretory system conjugative DNA transfer family protein [Roseobacter fucihabitans]|uniref:type IV secretory system conjugative DNA transfer family protein n=1 Tax=Roseobacter fucihabitans TaxID=1537242 RepID=UPI00386DB7F6
MGKADREAASVLSNAQRHTHFLDSPRIVQAMSRSDFHFADLRHRITSVFLVLPPNRMDAYSRWLRLLVSQALQDIARDAGATKGPCSSALSGAPAAPLSATGWPFLRSPSSPSGVGSPVEVDHSLERGSNPLSTPRLYLGAR